MSLEDLLGNFVNNTRRGYDRFNEAFNLPIGLANGAAMSLAVASSEYFLFDSDFSQSIDVGINQIAPSVVLGAISSKIVQKNSHNKYFDKHAVLGYFRAITPAVSSNIIGSYIFQKSGVFYENSEPLQAALSVGAISVIGLSALLVAERNYQKVIQNPYLGKVASYFLDDMTNKS